MKPQWCVISKDRKGNTRSADLRIGDVTLFIQFNKLSFDWEVQISVKGHYILEDYFIEDITDNSPISVVIVQERSISKIKEIGGALLEGLNLL